MIEFLSPKIILVPKHASFSTIGAKILSLPYYEVGLKSIKIKGLFLAKFYPYAKSSGVALNEKFVKYLLISF